MDSHSMEEEEHQKASLNVPVNDHLDSEKSKPLISRAPEPELGPVNAVGERGEEQEAVQEVVPSPVQFSCEVCPKVFSSGKALGGHKRIHSQAKKKKQPRVVAGSSRQLEAKVAREPITTCPVCKAEFPSEKAMSGHMRVHKDRSWRGLQPPERRSRVSPSPNPSPSLGSAMDDNLSQLNHGDRAYDEPEAAGENPSLRFDGSDTHLEKSEDKNGKEDGEVRQPGEMAELADALMLLTHGHSRPSGFSPQLEEDRRMGSECLPQPEIDSTHRTCSRRALLQRKKVEGKKRKLDDCHAGEGDDHGDDLVNSKMGTMTRVYKCGICNRIFSSHQAYGGHLSSHNKIKKQTLGPYEALQGPGSAAGRSSSGKVMEQHEGCGIVGSRPARPRHVLDFDLNKPPAPDSDQGRR